MPHCWGRRLSQSQLNKRTNKNLVLVYAQSIIHSHLWLLQMHDPGKLILPGCKMRLDFFKRYFYHFFLSRHPTGPPFSQKPATLLPVRLDNLITLRLPPPTPMRFVDCFESKGVEYKIALFVLQTLNRTACIQGLLLESWPDGTDTLRHHLLFGNPSVSPEASRWSGLCWSRLPSMSPFQPALLVLPLHP